MQLAVAGAQGGRSALRAVVRAHGSESCAAAGSSSGADRRGRRVASGEPIHLAENAQTWAFGWRFESAEALVVGAGGCCCLQLTSMGSMRMAECS